MTFPSLDMPASELLMNAFEVASVGYWDAPPGPLIYHAVNKLTGQSYVGATEDFVRRARDHHATSEKGGSPLCCAMRKFGAGAFVFVPIEYFADEAAMKQGL
jgi:predicted GIY-YIG superfamily endonuclease